MRRFCLRAALGCLLYSGFSAAAREFIYKASPLANWMGTVNCFLTLNLLGAGLGLLSLLLPPRIGFNVIFGGIMEIVTRIFIGFAAGSIVHFAAPGIRLAFREYRPCYYIMPLIAAGFGIYLLVTMKLLKE